MNENVINNNSQEMHLIDRNLLTISGIKKLVSFDPNEFILETNLGPLHISGNGLELLSLDNKDGIIKIRGKFIGYNYIERISKKKDESFIAKLFK